MAEVDRAANDALRVELHELRAEIYRLSGADDENADALGRFVDGASEGIARVRQALADSSAALSDYETNHVILADGHIASTTTASGVGKAAFAVAAAIAAAGMAKTAQLGASAEKKWNKSSGPDTRARLTKEFEQARAESLEKNGDVRRSRRQLRALFAQALRDFFRKHGEKIDRLLKVAGIGVPLAGLLVAVGVVTGGGAVAAIGLAPFYLAAAKFAVEMAKHEVDHGFKHDGKTYLMVSKEVLKVILAADSAKLFLLKSGDIEVPLQFNTASKEWTKAAVAAADYAWKIIELRNRRGFRSGSETFSAATKETFTAAFAVSAPLVGEKTPVIVAQAACTAFFKIVKQRPAGGFRWKKKQFFKTVSKEVFKSSVGVFLKINANAEQQEAKAAAAECRVKNIVFKHVETAWGLGSDKIPDVHVYFKKHSEAYKRMVEQVEAMWKRT